MRFDSPETKAVRFHRPVQVKLKELAVLRVVSLVVLPTIPNYILLRPISTQEKFPRTENFPKISLLKLENFQLQNFFPTESLCRPITFYKFFFLRKIFRNLCLQFYYNFTIWEITMEQGSSLMA
jgi:hypothetical protein